MDDVLRRNVRQRYLHLPSGGGIPYFMLSKDLSNDNCVWLSYFIYLAKGKEDGMLMGAYLKSRMVVFIFCQVVLGLSIFNLGNDVFCVNSVIDVIGLARHFDPIRSCYHDTI